MISTLIICFLCGFIVGLHIRRVSYLIKKTTSKLRRGICLRYQYGPRVWRDGTLSNFCLRCGHPYGAHEWH